MDSSTINIKSRCLLICGLMLFSVLSLLAVPVQASTSSQNDFGTSGHGLCQMFIKKLKMDPVLSADSDF